MQQSDGLCMPQVAHFSAAMGKREADSGGADEDGDNFGESLNICEEEDYEEADKVEFEI